MPLRIERHDRERLPEGIQEGGRDRSYADAFGGLANVRIGRPARECEQLAGLGVGSPSSRSARKACSSRRLRGASFGRPSIVVPPSNEPEQRLEGLALMGPAEQRHRMNPQVLTDLWIRRQAAR